MSKLAELSDKLVRAKRTQEVEKELGHEKPQPAVTRIPNLFKAVFEKLTKQEEPAAPPSEVIPPVPTSGGSY